MDGGREGGFVLECIRRPAAQRCAGKPSLNDKIRDDLIVVLMSNAAVSGAGRRLRNALPPCGQVTWHFFCRVAWVPQRNRRSLPPSPAVHGAMELACGHENEPSLPYCARNGSDFGSRPDASGATPAMVGGILCSTALARISSSSSGNRAGLSGLGKCCICCYLIVCSPTVSGGIGNTRTK